VSASSPASHSAIVRRLLGVYGQTFAEELGIKLHPQSPSQLFRLLCATLLFGTRISAALAMRGARALTEAGWTTPQKMAAATWEQRTRVLNRSGYARYDEKTSRRLADIARLLRERYGGDLRELRASAERDPARERELLLEFREVQIAWDERRPFADRRALRSARRLGLPADAESLARLVPKASFTRLVAALVRVDFEKAHAEIRGGSAPTKSRRRRSARK
jgi:hypothetical protein